MIWLNWKIRHFRFTSVLIEPKHASRFQRDFSTQKVQDQNKNSSLIEIAPNALDETEWATTESEQILAFLKRKIAYREKRLALYAKMP